MLGILLPTLEFTINRYLRLDSATITKIAKHKNKVIAFKITDWNSTFYLMPQNDGVQLFSQYSEKPDCTIAGTLFALFRVGSTSASSEAMFKNKIEFEGDENLGMQFREILKEIDIDWEEHLSRVAGDSAAHYSMKALRSMSKFGKSALSSLKKSMNEYLIDESHLLIDKEELETFYSHIAILRGDVDRLEARIQHLLKNEDNT